MLFISKAVTNREISCMGKALEPIEPLPYFVFV